MSTRAVAQSGKWRLLLSDTGNLCNNKAGKQALPRIFGQIPGLTGPAKGSSRLTEPEKITFLDFLIQREYLKGPHVDTVRMLQKSRFFFGVLALREEYITVEQLEKALTHQASCGAEQRIGQIMLDRGFMTQAQVDEVLAMQNASAENQAELIVDIGLMDPDKLEQALEEYRKLVSP